MSNPAVPPRETLNVDPDVPPSPYWEELAHPDWRAELKKAGTLPEVVAALQGLDVEYRPTFYIPKEHSVSSQVLQSSKPVMAQAKRGKLAARISSAEAFGLLTAVWKHLPEDHRGTVSEKILDTVFLDGGAEFAVGRLAQYAPRFGQGSLLVPPTAAEARAALIANGVDLSVLPTHAFRAFPLIPATAGEKTVMVNPKATTGFPVLGKGDDSEAQAKVHALAVTVRKELVQALRAPGGVWAWLRKAEDERPWLVSLQGKAKADYYSKAKATTRKLRFYNTYPKQIMLNIQVATQALEACKRNVFTDPNARTTLGISLVRGGAAELVAAMERQLRDEQYAYVHCGDDSWVVFRDAREQLHMFALDCSSFDLTQYAEVLAPLLRELADQLRQIDAPAAELWHAYMRQRQVVVALTAVIRTRNMGPSGSALQSTVNGMLMDVYIRRLMQRIVPMGLLVPGMLEELVTKVGSTLGLTVRLEQYTVSEAGFTLRDFLSVRPFLFIGYNFYHTWDGGVRAYCDLPRQCAQLRYPSLKWMRKGQEMAVREAMRLGSIMLNWGVPPEELVESFAAGRRYAVDLIDKCIARYGDMSDPSLRWAVHESPFGFATVGSLSGLKAALERTPEELWLHPLAELSSTSEWVAVDRPVTWADEVDEAEREERAALGIPPVPAAEVWPPAAATVSQPKSTHPVTQSNLGRPPPTAVWHPALPARPRRLPRRTGRIARVLGADDEEERYVSYRYPVYEEDDEPLYEGPRVVDMEQEEYEDWRNDSARQGGGEAGRAYVW